MVEMIHISNLTKQFGALVAVDNVSMTVNSGEVVGFLGPNGAGKSTTMKMVAGFLSPTSGSIEVCGYNVVEEPIAAKEHIGFLPEGAPMYDDLTPAGFLDFIGEIRGLDGKEREKAVHEAMEKTALFEVAHQPIETLSKGFKRRVSLAQAFLHNPDVLLLDEPTDGLDPVQKFQMRKLIREMSTDKAIIVSTHILEEVDALCTRVCVIANGRIMADGTAQDIRAKAPAGGRLCASFDLKDKEPAILCLKGLDGVTDISTDDDTEHGLVHVTAEMANTNPDTTAASKRLADRGIEIRELFRTSQRLDGAFRHLAKEADREIAELNKAVGIPEKAQPEPASEPDNPKEAEN